jgi:alpha-glucosidase
LYFDKADAPSPSKVGIETQEVNSNSQLDVSLPATGGEAIWLEPISK